MMWGSFMLGVCMMMISILLSFQERGGQLAKSTASASVAFFFLYMVSLLSLVGRIVLLMDWPLTFAVHS